MKLTDSRAALDRTAEGGCPHVSRSAGEWLGYFDRLLEHGRAVRAKHSGMNYWVAAERAKAFSLLFLGAEFDRPVAEIQVIPAVFRRCSAAACYRLDVAFRSGNSIATWRDAWASGF